LTSPQIGLGQSGSTRSSWVTITIVLLALIALAELAQAWSAFRADSPRLTRLDKDARGTLCSVLLVNGQIYYGTLAEAAGGMVKLSEVYYVRVVNEPGGSAQTNQVVSRRKTDWHSPDWMMIPLDKIVFVEHVGSESQLATLIAQDRASSAPK
jgi:hypothetical protein